MIVVDSSAVIAVALRESGWQGLNEALGSGPIAIGCPTLLEIRIAISKRRTRKVDEVMAMLMDLENIRLINFGADHLAWSEIAFERLGKGRGHPAQLNFGDCMAYAVAKDLDAPLLFKGGDFAKTDIRVHPASIAA